MRPGLTSDEKVLIHLAEAMVDARVSADCRVADLPGP
jgi:hypothetical protein